MVTHILFDLCLFKHFSPVTNFGRSGDQSLLALLLTKHKRQSIIDVGISYGGRAKVKNCSNLPTKGGRSQKS